MVRLTPFRFGRNPRQGNGKNLRHSHPYTGDKIKT